MIDYFFGKKSADLLSGKRLNNSTDIPYIKKRLDGKGGYRVYFLVKIAEDKLYLMFMHPKTGPDGSDNITPESKAKIYKDVLTAIKENDLYELSINGTNSSKIDFKKL